MEFIRLDSDASLRLLRQGGVFGYYSRTLILWVFFYAVTTFIVLKFVYFQGGDSLRESALVVEVAFAGVIALCVYRTHATFIEVREAIGVEGRFASDRELLARTFLRAFSNLGGLLTMLSVGNLVAYILMQSALSW